jgi:hypothetical protein
MREETFKEAFKDFYYYSNENDPYDKNNTVERKFYNPHTSTNTKSQYTHDSDNSTNTNTGEKAISSSSIDTKFSRIKMASNNNSLLRHYRQHSGISNGGSTINYNQRSSLDPNMQY